MDSRKGFTLMEIMISLAIIGILFTTFAPLASQYLARARDTTRITDLITIQKALSLYESDNDNYPTAMSVPNLGYPIFDLSYLDFIEEANAVIVSGEGPCPAIGIVCGPGYDPYQDPFTCAQSCVPSSGWIRTDDQCSSYLSDPKFIQIIGEVPRDPQKKNPFPCLDSSSVGSYGYATATGSDGDPQMILTAELETEPMANIGQSDIESALSTNNLSLLKDRKKGDYISSPGDSPYYVIYE